MLSNNKVRFYIYKHTRPDTGEIFYIGKGNTSKTSHEERYKTSSSRNRMWRNIVKKNNGNFIAEIICYCDTEDEVNKLENEYIKKYGRKDLGCGSLCNMTDGGDGSVGVKVGDETRKKLRDRFSGENHPNFGKKLSKETCLKKSESMKRSDKNLKGKKLPDWWKEKIKVTKIGERNPMFGKPSTRAKKVIDTATGIEYSSIMEAAGSTPYQFQYVSAMLNGTQKNKTTLKFA